MIKESRSGAGVHGMQMWVSEDDFQLDVSRRQM